MTKSTYTHKLQRSEITLQYTTKRCLGTYRTLADVQLHLALECQTLNSLPTRSHQYSNLYDPHNELTESVKNKVEKSHPFRYVIGHKVSKMYNINNEAAMQPSNRGNRRQRGRANLRRPGSWDKPYDIFSSPFGSPYIPVPHSSNLQYNSRMPASYSYAGHASPPLLYSSQNKSSSRGAPYYFSRTNSDSTFAQFRPKSSSTSSPASSQSYHSTPRSSTAERKTARYSGYGRYSFRPSECHNAADVFDVKDYVVPAMWSNPWEELESEYYASRNKQNILKP
ncbi:hypothetical protein AB6A40_005898 [Gnathostoma spinigerum]|uniref:Uncharacterized protein n=1 Tax=Gnathostoma spinigerum TaxID=75299 RepID=A0ABD6EPF6_9BILA